MHPPHTHRCTRRYAQDGRHSTLRLDATSWSAATGSGQCTLARWSACCGVLLRAKGVWFNTGATRVGRGTSVRQRRTELRRTRQNVRVVWLNTRAASSLVRGGSRAMNVLCGGSFGVVRGSYDSAHVQVKVHLQTLRAVVHLQTWHRSTYRLCVRWSTYRLDTGPLTGFACGGPLTDLIQVHLQALRAVVHLQT